MKKNATNYLLFLFCLAIFSGCKKELKTNDISGTSWKKISQVTNGYNSWLYPERMKCQLDDITEFKPGGELLIIDAGEQCNPPSQQKSNWRVSSGWLYIGSTQYRVEKFSKSELILHAGQTYVTYQRY